MIDVSNSVYIYPLVHALEVYFVGEYDRESCFLFLKFVSCMPVYIVGDLLRPCFACGINRALYSLRLLILSFVQFNSHKLQI